ncbi:MAG TPA: ABC transporter permease [Polyangiaceae bacterium]|nr:ABC transporter permease [Polyangiaceae bacterium]
MNLDSWQELLHTLSANKLRAFLTACGVFWGIFMLVFMLGMGTGLERGVRRSLGNMTSRAVYVWSQRTSLPYRGLQPGRYLKFHNADAEALRRVPGVVYVAPRLQLGAWRAGTNAVYKGRTGNFVVLGDSPEFFRVEPSTLKRGRVFNPRDQAEVRKVAVIGDQARHVLFGEEDPIGKYISVRGVYLMIIGEISSEKSGDDGERIRSSLFVPLSTFQAAFNQRDRIGWFTLTAREDVDPEQLEQRVKATLRGRHGVHPEDRDALGSFNLAAQINKVNGLFRGIQSFVWFVGTMTLLAGVLGVGNILLITVKERTREFGVRKALGATPSSVVNMVLREALLLTSMAGYTGLVASVGGLELMARVVAKLQNAPIERPEVDLRVALIATLVLIIAGTLAGLVPAVHAARIRPVEALRSE